MDSRIQTIIVYIETNLHRKLSFNKMAQSVNLSLSHLHHLFKDEIGMSPAKYLKHLRMQRALYLLETTFLTVKEIMLRIGMQDESHFIRDFRKAYGMTPIRYRAFYLASDTAKVNQLTEAAKLANK